MTDIASKVEFLKECVSNQFNSRAIIEANKQGLNYGITLHMEERDHILWITFTKGKEVHSINVPIPYKENGVVLIKNNEVSRSVCKYWLEEKQLMLDYLDVMYYILCNDPVDLIPNHLIKKIIFIQQIVYSFENKNTSTIIYNLQRAINEIVNRLPLHITNTNSWAMNRRIMIIDPEFDIIQDPKERLDYHINKSRKYFHKGWSSMGLSDGSLADKNYILDYDLRKLTPFGMKFHNPQRNLYSALGMKGDEDPLVRSVSMEKIQLQGVKRKGWNLFTMFVDIPDVWEDQIMVDESLSKLSITYEKRIQCFGIMVAKKGQRLLKGDIISIAPQGKTKKFDITCDRAKIHKIEDSIQNVGGLPTVVHNVLVKYERKLKEGVKITNTAANKGVIRMIKNLGYAVDPRTGEMRKIDIIVACKAVSKRKNYTQILEALLNNVTDESGFIVADNECPTIKQIETKLEEKGFPKDGTWQCHTYMGDLIGICGVVFWGVTHDVEDMLWEKEDVIKTNVRDLRVAGLKFSTVEARALQTRFGKNNPILDEIMSYSQGSAQLHELLKVLRSKQGELSSENEIIDVSEIKPVDQSTGTIVPKTAIIGSIADENLFPNGFTLKLPIEYQVAIDFDNEIVNEGHQQIHGPEEIKNLAKVLIIDKIYVPTMELRRCWQHETGRYGLSEVGALLNNIITVAHRVLNEPEVGTHLSTLYKVVYNYYARVATRLGTKRGDLSVYGMAIRYPFSAKAVATLSNSLPKNTIEIHRETADLLEIENGDVVLVERFPCMGFMSIRPQKVHITHNDKCKYTIRASKNSLGSLSLDFDGDVLFIAAFHTPEAKEALKKEWTNPNKPSYSAIQVLNDKMGKPHTKELTLQNYNIQPFEELNEDTHASIIDKATGVKSHTGPVIAFAYNIMRIMENSSTSNNQKINCAVEIFLDKVGNSVFKQKHGIKSLHEACIDAICIGDVDTLVNEGFERSTSTIICNTIKEKAIALGIKDLKWYHEVVHKQKGFGTIISRIVRTMNKVWHASRSSYEGIKLLNLLQQPIVDIPSKMLAWSLSGKAEQIRTPLDKKIDQALVDSFETTEMKGTCLTLFDALENICTKVKATTIAITRNLIRKLNNSIIKSVGVMSYAS